MNKARFEFRLAEGCIANLDNVQLVPFDRLLRQAGTVARDRWPEVCVAMRKVWLAELMYASTSLPGRCRR